MSAASGHGRDKCPCNPYLESYVVCIVDPRGPLQKEEARYFHSESRLQPQTFAACRDGCLSAGGRDESEGTAGNAVLGWWVELHALARVFRWAADFVSRFI